MSERDELRRRLQEVFGKDVQVMDVKSERRKRMAEDPGLIPYKPLTGARAKEWIAANWKPRLGDVVTLRTDMAFERTWPIIGEEVVVTGMLDEPIRDNTGGNGDVVGNDMMLLSFEHECGEEGCPVEHTIFDWAYDPRNFLRVGNIYEGYEPKGRPLIPGLHD